MPETPLPRRSPHASGKSPSAPQMEVLFPLVRFLKMDPRDIFYPERDRNTPELRRLRTMMEDCTEEEAGVMVSVFQSVLQAIRDPNSRHIDGGSE